MNRFAELWRYLIGKANRIGPAISKLVVGGAVRPTDDAATNLRVYEVDNWVYSAITVIARSLAGVPLIVKDTDDELITEGEVVDLLARPNPEMDGYQLRLGTIIDMLATGRAYWSIEKEAGRYELYLLRPDKMLIRREKDGKLAGYRYEDGTFKKDYEINEIIHFLLFNPHDQNYGLSPIKPLENAIDLMHYVKRHHIRYFKKGGMPSGVIETDDSPTPDECKEISARFAELYSGDESFATAVIGGKGVYKPITPPIKDMMFTELRRAVREDILSVWPVPPFILGILDKASYANSHDGKAIFWEHCCQPFGQLMESAINLRLPAVLGGNISFVHNYADVDALHEDGLKEQQRLCGYVKSGIMTPNEARSELNMDDIEGGDELISTPSFSFSTGENDEAGKALFQISTLKADGSQPADRLTRHWKKFENRLGKNKGKFEKVMRGYFNGQLARILNNIDKISNGTRTALAQYVTKDTLDPDAADSIFDMLIEAKILKESTSPVVRQIIREEFAEVAADLGVDVAFDVTNPHVKEMIENGFNRIVGINDKSYESVKAIIKDGYERGASINEIKKDLTSTFSQFSKTRAKTIAQNEVGSYVNGGSLEAAKASGVVKTKQWVSARLSTARQTHIDVENAGPIPLDNVFDVAGYPADCPHDPGLPPEESIWCHCTVIYEV